MNGEAGLVGSLVERLTNRVLTLPNQFLCPYCFFALFLSLSLSLSLAVVPRGRPLLAGAHNADCPLFY
jgi:hypothetical protein